jgi:hypothetical protein
MFVTGKQIEEMKKFADGANKKLATLREKAEAQAGKAKLTAEAVGGGLVGGWMDGRFGAGAGEKTKDGTPIKEGHVNLFGLQFVPSSIGGAGLVVGAMFGVFGKNTDDALHVGAGMLAGTAYGFGLSAGKSGKAKGGWAISGASSPDLIGDGMTAAVGYDPVREAMRSNV